MTSLMNARQRPLSGIRIIELARHISMPLATRILADMGAEVIKVEAAVAAEPGRALFFPDNEPGERSWDRGGYYHEMNRHKRHVSLDLGKPEARAALLRLVEKADVVAENFTPRVMRNLDLDYDRLREVKPDIIVVSNTGFGQTGPWANYKAFGASLEATTGQSHFTGYAGGRPARSTIAYTDSPAAMLNAFVILAALEHRRRTGRGQWTDVSMYEVGVALLGEALADYFMNGRVGGRMGNRDPQLLQGCYPTAGRDRWVALTVESDAQWAALCRAMGRAGLASDPRFASAPARLAHHDEADAIISAWTGPRDHHDVMRTLQAVGVPAGAVLTNKELLLDPHLAARGFFEEVDGGGLGPRLYPGMPWKTAAFGSSVRSVGPAFGQDNRAVLKELAGLADAEIAKLYERGALSNRPEIEEHGRTGGIDEMLAAGALWPPDPDFQAILDRRPRPE